LIAEGCEQVLQSAKRTEA